ncbi:MAG: glycosyltransferase [Pseudomonadota bacterium]
MGTRPRVLVLAEAANPELVSVPLVGWSLATALTGVADAHIVTQIRNRAAFLRAGLQEGRDFTATDTAAVAERAWRLASRLRGSAGVGWTVNTAMQSLAYPYFERLVWRRFEAALRDGAYDLVHRVTPVSPTATSPIARRLQRIGVPFVLGPLNGGIPWPPGFEDIRTQEREWLSLVRGLYRYTPGRDRALAATSLIFAGSRHTLSEIPARHRPRAMWLPENAIDPARFNRVAVQDGQGPLRACFVGRLVPYKGPDMLIEAAAPLLAAGRMRLDVIGEGPIRPALEAAVAAAGATDAVTFHGWLEHGAVQDVMAGTEVLAFPSVREFGGGVVLEAMALGVVPIVVDYGGPAELLEPGTGYTVPLADRAGVIAGTRAALERALAERAGLPAMAEAGRALVAARYTWARKAEQIRAAYDRLLAGQGIAA